MKKMSGEAVYVVDGSRSPYLKSTSPTKAMIASDLAIKSAYPLLARQPFSPEELDEVILGCMMSGPDEANIGRVVSLRLGCGKRVPAWTVQSNCGSGMQALDCAARNIASGRADLIMAGGVESMSHAPLLFPPEMTSWLGNLTKAKTFQAKAKLMAKFKPANLKPIIGLLRGLTDPTVGLNMGHTAEILADKFNISRLEMDEYAVLSHQRLLAANEEGRLVEIETIYDWNGNIYDHDEGARPDSSVENLARLKPAFDKKFGKVTPGNSSQITDGAAWLILASEEAVKKHQLPIMGRIVDATWAGNEPREMGLGPVHASTPLLKRNRLNLDKIDYLELNEAFAAQVIGCCRAWADDDYCKKELGLKSAFGQVDPDKLNVDGGAISVGHPVGSSGARIVLHLLHTLEQRKATRGLATLCIGGGQGGAMLVERG